MWINLLIEYSKKDKVILILILFRVKNKIIIIINNKLILIKYMLIIIINWMLIIMNLNIKNQFYITK